RASGMAVLAFLGPAASPLDTDADLALHVEGDVAGLVQQGHITIGHALCGWVERRLAPGPCPARRCSSAATAPWSRRCPTCTTRSGWCCCPVPSSWPGRPRPGTPRWGGPTRAGGAGGGSSGRAAGPPAPPRVAGLRAGAGVRRDALLPCPHPPEGTVPASARACRDRKP